MPYNFAFGTLQAYVLVFKDGAGDASVAATSTEPGRAVTCFLSLFDAVLEVRLRTALGQLCHPIPASFLNGNVFRDGNGKGFIADIHLGWPARDGRLLQTPSGSLG